MKASHLASALYKTARRGAPGPPRQLSRHFIAADALGTSRHGDSSSAGNANSSAKTHDMLCLDSASLGRVRGFAASAEEPKGTNDGAPDTSVIHPKGGSAAQGVKAPSASDAEGKGPAIASAKGKDDGGAAVTEMKVAAGQGVSRGSAEDGYWLMQPVYRKEYVEGIHPKHLQPKTIRQHLAFKTINVVRWFFDRATGYGPNMKEKDWLRRVVFLETVAGVPGMVGGMLRHMKSLRSMERDHAWIHTLLEEAENERMHLLTFMQLRQPGILFRGCVLGAQGFFFNFLFVAYLINPRWVHSFVGYLEEEAVRTYTHCIADLDAGKLPEWEKMKAPEIAVKYWALQEGRDSMRDLLLAVRADEAGHSYVNHTLSQLKATDANPFAPGSHEVP